MTTITQNVRDIAGVSDNAWWRFSTVLREGSDEASIVTGRVVTVKPVAGVLTVELDPGPAIVKFANQTYVFTVPEGDSDLWSLIEAAVAVPPNTPAQQLAAAIEAYLDAHPPGGGLADIVADTTPQLGGDLDLNGHTVGVATAADLTWLHANRTALQALLTPPTPAAVSITTTGATFSPAVELVGGSTGTVNWSWSGGSTTGLAPTIGFGSAGTRTVTMTVTDGATDKIGDVRTFNIGFDHTQDAGTYMPSSSYDHAAQAVSGLSNVNAMTGLVNFLASTPSLAGALDFTGMTNLQFIECYQSQVTAVTLAGCASLIRLDVEQSQLSTLDLNPVHATLRDLRAAVQRGGAGITFAPLTGGAVMDHLYHYCVRGQTVTGHYTAAQMPALQQLWDFWCSRTGTLDLGGTSTLYEVLSEGNSYTAVTGIAGTALTHLTLNGNVGFNAAAVDAILVAVNALGTSNGNLNLSNTTPPTSTGLLAASALTGRGWTVLVDAGAPSTPSAPTLTPGDTQLGVSWVAPANGGSAITSYDVRYRTSPSGSYSTVNVTSGTSTTVTGLTNGTAYDVGVRANNAVGSSAYSANATATPAAATWSYSNTFDTDRANMADLAADGFTTGSSVLSASSSASASVSGGNLNRTSTGYQGIMQTTALAPVADYEVSAVIPDSQARLQTYHFLALRCSGGDGVRVGWADTPTDIVFGQARDYAANNVAVTVDAGITWVGTGDHTVTVRAVGSLIQLYTDGTLAAHATVTFHATSTNTSYGVCGGGAFTYRSLSATQV